MNHTRRRLLLGIATLGAGAGLIGGTGAFTSVEADREVTVEFADDSEALLEMTSPNEEGEGRSYVSIDEGDDGTISIIIEDVNRNAKTKIDNLVRFQNNGSQTVSLSAEFVGDPELIEIHDKLDDINQLGPGEDDTGLGFTIDLLGETGDIEISETITITAESTED